MKKQKLIYRFFRYDGEVILAKKETPFEIKLTARLVLDNLCYTWNKEQLQKQLDDAIDCGNVEKFNQLSTIYRSFV